MDGEKQVPGAAEKLLFHVLVGNAYPGTPVIADPKQAGERVGKPRSPQALLSAGVTLLGSVALSASSLVFQRETPGYFPSPLGVPQAPQSYAWGRRPQRNAEAIKGKAAEAEALMASTLRS